MIEKKEKKYEYKPDTCTSTVTPNLTSFAESIKQFGEDAKAVVWYHHEIVFLTEENWIEKLKDLTYVVRLRLFDAKKELHIWRTNGELRGRLREDDIENGENTDFVESNQVLNWNDTLEKLHFTKTKDNQAKVKLLARNYIEYSDIGQAHYMDCRFVDIV